MVIRHIVPVFDVSISCVKIWVIKRATTVICKRTKIVFRSPKSLGEILLKRKIIAKKIAVYPKMSPKTSLYPPVNGST